MERIVYRVNLDAMRTGIQTTLQGFSAGEKLSREVKINLSAKGEAIYLGQDSVATMYVTKKGAITPSVNDCLIEDNCITYVIREEDIDTAGMVRMQLKVITTDKVLITPVFALDVMASDIDDSAAIASPTFTALDEALLRAKEVYDKQLVNVEFVDYVFYANYADGSSYVNDSFKSLLEVVVNVDENEAARQEAEEARIASEVERINAELIRIANEEARVTAESARADAETIRALNEDTREANEAQRVLDESDRGHNETIREGNEILREANEQTRIANEQNREDTFDVEIERIEDAVTKSNEAVKVANKALDDVQGIIAGQGVVTQTERDNWNEAYDYRHIHPNKAFLDTLTRSQLDAKAETTYVDSEISRIEADLSGDISKLEQDTITAINNVNSDMTALAGDVDKALGNYLLKPTSGEAQGLVLMSNGDGTNSWGKVDVKSAIGTVNVSVDSVSDEIVGRIVTLARGNDVVTGAIDALGKVTLVTSYAGDYVLTVEGIPSISETVSIVAGNIYDVEVHIPHSTITVTTVSADLFGQTVTLSDGQTATFGENGESVEFTVYAGGNYTASVSNGTETFSNDFVVVIDEDIEVALNSTITLTLTLEGAKQDTISITDADGVLVGTCIFASGTSGMTEITIPIDDLDNDARKYTFTSSVAKAIDGSGADYAKSVTLTTSTESVFVFPSKSETDKSNMAYWYGNIFTENIGGIYCVPTGTYNTGNENHSNTVPILESNDIYLQANGQNEYPTKTSMFWFDNKINFSKYNESHILLDYQYSVAQTTSNSVIHNYLHPTVGKPDLNYVLVKFYSDYNSYNTYTYHNYVTDVSAISSEEYLTIFATRAAKAKIYAVYFN